MAPHTPHTLGSAPAKPRRSSTRAIAVTVLFLALLSVFVTASPAFAADPGRLAVLIAAPWEGEIAMSQDMLAISDALKQRGFRGEQIVSVEGVLTRNVLLDFLANVSRRVAGWSSGGDLFVFVSGHGAFRGTSAADARVGLLLSGDGLAADHEVWWDEVFATLRTPPGVRVILLPDT